MHFVLASVYCFHYLFSPFEDRLECSCFLLSCIYKTIHTCSVITPAFNSLIQMVSFSDIVCCSFLECINHFSFELVGVFRVVQFVSVLVG